MLVSKHKKLSNSIHSLDTLTCIVSHSPQHVHNIPALAVSHNTLPQECCNSLR